MLVRTGKVIVVDLDRGEIPRLFSHIDVSVRAQIPEEIATVACLKESKMTVGEYTDGAPAYRVNYSELTPCRHNTSY